VKNLKLSKEECIMIFNSLEQVTIKGKDALKLAPLLVKLDKHLVTLHQEEMPAQPNLEKITSMAKAK
tara:strand:- start:62 stop:262 length:201 start_codon:yes stop_codon:yes gene_type:complete